VKEERCAASLRLRNDCLTPFRELNFFDHPRSVAPSVQKERDADPLPRIGAHIRKVPSMKNGGEKSGTGERARKWASDRQASPLAEGDRNCGTSISNGRGGCKERGLAAGKWCGWADVGEWEQMRCSASGTEAGSSDPRHLRSAHGPFCECTTTGRQWCRSSRWRSDRVPWPDQPPGRWMM
jgi:hypothetical protein